MRRYQRAPDRTPITSTMAKVSSPPVFLVLIGLVVVQVGFGGYGIVLKKFAEGAGADALVFSLCRDALCFPVLLIAAFITERNFGLPKAKELPLFMLLGLTGMFGNQYLYIEGLYFSSPNVASIMQPLIPVFTALLAFVLCVEKLPGPGRMHQWWKILGIAFAVGGAILMTLSAHAKVKYEVTGTFFNGTDSCSSTNSSSFSVVSAAGKCTTSGGVSQTLDCDGGNITLSVFDKTDCSGTANYTFLLPVDTCLNNSATTSVEYDCSEVKAKNAIVGLMLLIGNCSCMAVYVLLQKIFIFRPGASMHKWSKYPVAVTAFSYFWGAVVMALAAGIRYATNRDASLFTIPKKTIAGLVYAVLVSSALCYGLITWCNKYVSATVVTSFWPLQVFVTVILSYFVFGNKLILMEYVGMVLIIIGMFLVSYGNHVEKKNKADSEEHKALLINTDN